MLAVGCLRWTTEIFWRAMSGGNRSAIEYKPLDLTNWMVEIGVCGISKGIWTGRLWAIGSRARMIKRLLETGAVWQLTSRRMYERGQWAVSLHRSWELGGFRMQRSDQVIKHRVADGTVGKQLSSLTNGCAGYGSGSSGYRRICGKWSDDGGWMHMCFEWCDRYMDAVMWITSYGIWN